MIIDRTCWINQSQLYKISPSLCHVIICNAKEKHFLQSKKSVKWVDEKNWRWQKNKTKKTPTNQPANQPTNQPLICKILS